MVAAPVQMDATPGRHNARFGPSGFRMHLTNMAGICTLSSFGLIQSPENDVRLLGFLDTSHRLQLFPAGIAPRR